MLASTLVITTPKHSRVHSNVTSHGVVLLLDDAKAGFSSETASCAHVSTIGMLRLSERVKSVVNDKTGIHYGRHYAS